MAGNPRSFFLTGLRALEDDLRESAQEARAAGLTEADWITVMVSEPEDFRPEALHALRLIAQATWRGHDVC
jgi:hypothetical protein